MTGSLTLRVTLAAALLCLYFPLQAEVTIPSSYCRGTFIVDVTWNDEVVRLLLDSGAHSTSIDPDAYQRAFGKRRSAGRRVSLRDGMAGPLRLTKIRAKLHEMDHLSLALGTSIDGILGIDTFRKLLLTLDYPAREVRVGKGSLPPPDDREIFRDIGKTRPFIELSLGEHKVPILVDSGFTGGIDINYGDPVEWEAEPRPVHASVRYSEIVLQDAGRIAGTIEFGPFTLDRPIVRVSDGRRLLGADVLEHAVVTFDRTHRRVRLTPDKESPLVLEPFRGWGVALRPRRTGMEVIKVFPGTPADDAGIREGDLLTRVDGTPVHERGCRRVDADGTLNDVEFERDGVTITASLESVILVP